MEKKKGIKSLLRWETLLVVLLVVLWAVFSLKDQSNIANGQYKKAAFGLKQLIPGLQPYLLYGFMTLGMMMVLAMGDIDISVGATGALSASVLFVLYGKFTTGGMDPKLALALSIIAGLLTGTLCGSINGLLITKFKELFPMIITLSTMLFFRGMCYLLLGGNTLVYKGDDVFNSIKVLSNNVKIGGVKFPVILFWFLGFAIVFYIILHHTTNGRKLFAVGTNPVTSRYSGIKVDKIKIIVFAITGLMSAITSIFYVASASSGSIRADAMEGYEMYAIAAAVLGGFSTDGGKGNVIGVIISMIIFGLLKKGLGTVFSLVDSTVNLAVGVVLILSVLLPNIAKDISDARKLKAQHEAIEKEHSNA